MTSRARGVALGASALLGIVGCLIGLNIAGGSPSEVLGISSGAPAEPLPAARRVSAEPEPIDASGSAALALKPLFNVLDCEREGVVRPNEVDEHIAQLLSVHDRDGSRTISRGEYLRAAQGAAREQLGGLFDSIDTRRDGVLSAKEFGRHVVALIDAVDSNRDGEVTRLELEQGARAPRQVR